jgi:ankyrin repeat protein
MNYDLKYKKYKTKYIELLKQKGGATTLDNPTKLTIFNSIEENNIELLIELLTRYTEAISIVNRFDQTLLIYALTRTNINKNIVNLLIDKGVDLEKQDRNNGCTALIYAIKRNQIDIVKLLIEKSVNLEKQDNYGNTALLHAIISDNIEITKLLVENNALTNIVNSDNKITNAITFAYDNNRRECYQYLLAKSLLHI